MHRKELLPTALLLVRAELPNIINNRFKQGF